MRPVSAPCTCLIEATRCSCGHAPAATLCSAVSLEAEAVACCLRALWADGVALVHRMMAGSATYVCTDRTGQLVAHCHPVRRPCVLRRCTTNANCRGHLAKLRRYSSLQPRIARCTQGPVCRARALFSRGAENAGVRENKPPRRPSRASLLLRVARRRRRERALIRPRQL